MGSQSARHDLATEQEQMLDSNHDAQHNGWMVRSPLSISDARREKWAHVHCSLPYTNVPEFVYLINLTAILLFYDVTWSSIKLF